MDAFLLLLIGFLLWPVIRSFAELAITATGEADRAAMIESAGWFALTLTCLVGAAACIDVRQPLGVVAFTVLSVFRLAKPHARAATVFTLAKLASARSGR